MPRKILVTGATGKVASLVVPSLKKLGHTVRALVHDPAKAARLKEAGVEAVPGDFGKPESMRAAFTGMDTVFLVTPPHPNAADWGTQLIAAAKAAGSPHLVRLSVVKADENGPTDNTKMHGRSDREVRASGLPYTLLRPHFFMQNLFGSAQSIASDGVMYWGMGNGRLGLIDARDIADAAIKVLDAPDAHAGKAYDLTGPQSLTFHDMAKTLTKVLGREVKYIPVPVEQVVNSIKQAGMGDWFANVMGQYSKAYSDNWGVFVNDEVKKLTGHPARSFEAFAREVFAPALQQPRNS